jgi:serine protease Do
VFVRSSGGRGTGWVYDLDQRYLVTNQHVTGGEPQVNVGMNEQLRPARVVGEAECEDLAVLQVEDASGMKQLALGSQSELKIGDPVVAVGYPASVGQGGDFDRFDLSGSDGTVAVPETSNGPYTNLVRTTAQINSGQSGGPLVTTDEEVVGVTTVTFSDAQKFDIENGAIGIDRVKEVVPRLIAGESVC